MIRAEVVNRFTLNGTKDKVVARIKRLRAKRDAL